MEKVLLKLYRSYVPRWMKRGLSDDTKDLLLGLLVYVASRPNLETLRLRNRATSAMRRHDWRDAVHHWQLLNIQSREIARGSMGKVPPADELARKSAYARNQLRTARLQLAIEMHGKGKFREFRELTARVVEAIPDQRVLKKDKAVLNLVATYVQTALSEDGHPPAARSGTALTGKPLKIVICLDVLKVSDVHTHSRVVFAMCRNLLSVHPDAQTHVVITNERFVATAPVMAQAFNPMRNETVQELARDAFGESYGTRFFLHMLRDTGLEGLVRSAKEIIEIDPDVLLFGGGHRGLFSNESRLIRHSLYNHFPTAFFYIQSNNQVDTQLDMIIARGPHEIIGNSGEAALRIQPYPTISGAVFSDDQQIDVGKQAKKIIVSAITGVRMNIKMAEMSDATLKSMFRILDQFPDAVWHLIGASDPQALIAANPLITRRVKSGQIKVHAVMPLDVFTQMISQASLFLHMPGFTGGSGGAAVARRAGIPILTFSHSDVSGRQPAQTVFEQNDVKGWAAMACKLLRDPDVWLDTVQAQRAHTDWIRQTSGDAFYACLEEAVTIGQKRIGGSNRPLG
jgi:hypothetical protein